MRGLTTIKLFTGRLRVFLHLSVSMRELGGWVQNARVPPPAPGGMSQRKERTCEQLAVHFGLVNPPIFHRCRLKTATDSCYFSGCVGQCPCWRALVLVTCLTRMMLFGCHWACLRGEHKKPCSTHIGLVGYLF